SETNERGVGERQPHIAGKLPRLRAVCFVRHHDNIVALAVWLCDLLIKLVYQAEHEAMVLLEYLPQGRARAGARCFLIGDATADKGTPDLVVQILTVGHDDEREVPRHYASDFLRKERHRIRLAAPLSVPEHAEPTKVRVGALHQG